MVQTMQFRWKIETDQGHVLQDDIMLQNSYEANKYAQNYISSFSGWTVDIVPLKKEEDEQVQARFKISSR